MTEDEKTRVRELRNRGLGMQAIADIMKMSRDNVRYLLRKEGLGGAVGNTAEGRICMECGRTLIHTDGKRKRRFCSDSCRMKWWNRRRDTRRSKSMKELACPVCGQIFWAYGSSHRRFCSTECYLAWRKSHDDGKAGE